MTEYLWSSFTNFQTEDFMNSFEEHDSKKLAKAINKGEGGEEPGLNTAMSSDFSNLRKSVTANFSLLLGKSFSQELQEPSFAEPAPVAESSQLGKRAGQASLTPPKSGKKSKGKSSGNSAKSKTNKNKSPLKDTGATDPDLAKQLRKQFSFGDLSLALNAAGDGSVHRVPSLADIGFTVKLEGNTESERDKMNLRSQSSPKPAL